MKGAQDDFEKAAERPQTSLGREMLDLLRHNKKWWLVPILVALFALGVVIALAVIYPSAVPFIYPLF
jgi:hypothetical protein